MIHSELTFYATLYSVALNVRSVLSSPALCLLSFTERTVCLGMCLQCPLSIFFSSAIGNPVPRVMIYSKCCVGLQQDLLPFGWNLRNNQKESKWADLESRAWRRVKRGEGMLMQVSEFHSGWVLPEYFKLSSIISSSLVRWNTPWIHLMETNYSLLFF